MEQRTCNIILCCKGHCLIDSEELLGPQEAIAKYMSKECGCPVEDYKGLLLYRILRSAAIDFFRSTDNPSFYFNILLDSYSTYEPNMSECIITMFSLVGVQEKDKDGEYKYINGFTKELIEAGKKYLAE